MFSLEECLVVKIPGLVLVEPDVETAERAIGNLAKNVHNRPLLQWNSIQQWGQQVTALSQRLGLDSSNYTHPDAAFVLLQLGKASGGLKTQIETEQTDMSKGVVVSIYDLGDLVHTPSVARAVGEFSSILQRLGGTIIVIVPTKKDAVALSPLLVPIALTPEQKYGDAADSLVAALGQIIEGELKIDRWTIIEALDGLLPVVALALIKIVYRKIGTRAVAMDTRAILGAIREARKELQADMVEGVGP